MGKSPPLRCHTALRCTTHRAAKANAPRCDTRRNMVRFQLFKISRLTDKSGYPLFSKSFYAIATIVSKTLLTICSKTNITLT